MAEVPIDNLLITIKQTGGTEVARTLESMAKGLRSLRDSASGTKATAFNNLASGIKTIADAAASIKNVENLERMAAALERIKAIGTIKIKVPGTKADGGGTVTVGGGLDTNGGGVSGGNADAIEQAAKKMKDFEKAAKEADKTLASLKSKYFGWIKAIGRIALYRAIRSILKGIMQSLNDGLDHFYQYSVKVNGLYATARAEIKTSLHYVSDALGAAAGQLIEKIYPVVVKLLDMTAEIFNYISEAIAFMSGEDTYTKAVRGLADANAEAKKLKATLLGFDEINKLNGNNGSGEDEFGHFEEAAVNKVRASATTGILAGIGAFFAGSTIASIINDINKLTTALGTKGLAGAAQKAAESFGTEGTGANGTGGSGLLGVLGRVAAGLGAVVALKFTDTSFENFIAADEADEKLQAGIQTALGSVGTVALAGMAGGAAGIMIAIPAMLAIAIQDVLVNDEAREKVDAALSGFNEWVTKVVTGEDEAGGGRGITSKIITSNWFRDLSRYSSTARKLLTDETTKLTGTPAGDVTHLYRGSDGNFYTADQISTPTYTDTSPTVNVSLELDGEVVAKVVAKANNSYARRTLSAY